MKSSMRSWRVTNFVLSQWVDTVVGRTSIFRMMLSRPPAAEGFDRPTSGAAGVRRSCPAAKAKINALEASFTM